MKLSLNWIHDFLDLSDQSPEAIADLLTMKSCEVEGILPFMEHLDKILVARVDKVERHPDADKLVVCSVFNGKETIQIVTGAPNVKEGRLYPLAGIGVTLPGGMTMKKAKLRGIESFGMLCSAEEIGLEEFMFPESPEYGILPLPNDLKPGESLRKALAFEDTLLDIDNKSITHRPDLWSHFGFARELASLLGRKLRKNPAEAKFEGPSFKPKKDVDVKIEKDAAIAYCNAQFEGVQVSVSPLPIQARLIAAGMRPINNVVDASNYVMLEMGQPNHAFDREDIQKEIRIDFSKEGERLTTLDGEERTMPKGIVLIRDGSKPIAVGGVIGGADTEVHDDTTELFFESACFHRHHIRKAVSKLNLRTEASQRFEKGQTPVNAKPAIHLFGNLLKETCPDLRMSPIHEELTEEPRQNKIRVTPNYIRERLGESLTDARIRKILESLSIRVQAKKDFWETTIPTWRSYHDLTIPEDLVEEVGRVIGYASVPPTPIAVSCEVPQFHNRIRALEHELRVLFSAAYGFTEVYNYAFVSEDDCNLDTRFAEKGIRLSNPVSLDIPFLRTSPLPALLKNAAANHKQSARLKVYEIEKIFIPQKGAHDENSLPEERQFIAGIDMPLAHENPAENLRDLAASIADCLQRLGIARESIQFVSYESEGVFHPGRSGAVLDKSGRLCFRFGQLHPMVLERMGIERPVLYFEAFLSDLIGAEKDNQYRRLIPFPPSDFELTVIADAREEFGKLKNLIQEVKIPAEIKTESIDYVTEYSGAPIEPGKKAVSIKIVWRKTTGTLSGKELKKLQDNVVQMLGQSGFPLKS